MAQSLKEVEALAANNAAPVAPQPKPQPVALEIPVTVNGARTVDGSDKRVPFSENTQTVLIFPHGAVIRISTPLASGQLVFLTNEKTKKEIVCQVVKSKSSGAAGSYVELQFTEPGTGFWGLQIPGASSATLGPRPVASPAPAAPKAAPAVTITPKPAALPAPVAVEPPPVAKTVVLLAPPAAPVIPAPPAQIASQPETVVAVTPAPPAPVLAPPQAVAPQAPVVVAPPVVTEPEPIKSSAPVTVPAPPAAEVVPPAAELPAAPQTPETTAHTAESTTHQHSIPVPPIRDFSKQIEALFSVPQSPAAPASSQPQSAPASFGPSTEDLKQQAARLQEQLNSLTFTEAPAAAPATPADAKSALMEAPVAELTKLISEIAPGAVKHVAPAETKSADHVESKPVVSASKIASVTLSADDEVKMPSWLAPLAQNSETATETSAANTSTDNAVSENSEESLDEPGGDAHRRPQTAVFGGQLLGEAAATEDTPTSGFKIGLFIGIAAAIAVLAGAAWYFTQNHSGSATPSTHSNAATSTESAPVYNSAAPTSVPKSDSASSVPSQPSRNVAPTPAPVPTPSQPKNTKSAQKNQEPPPAEEPAKASLGEVHLAAPVVNRSDNSQLETDGLQAVATDSVPAGTDPFSGSHHNIPTAPLPVGGDVKPAELLKSVPPEFPAIAKSQHIGGKVTIDALIDASGNVASVKVLSGPTILHKAASDAVKQWKYKPAMLDGEATSMHLTVTVAFRAQ